MWLGAIVIDTDNSEELSKFYESLLGWIKEYQGEDKEWIVLYDEKRRYTPIVFQQDINYTPPIYPNEKDKPQQMVHLDFYVEHGGLEKATEHAISCGAVVAEKQYSSDWRVFLDPSGHTFCIIPIPEEMEKYFN